MIDLHSHILPGIDDGAPDLAGSLAIARAAVEDGIETMAATPHVRDDYPTTPEAMDAGVATVRAALAEQGIPLDLRTGGEIALDRVDLLGEAASRFALGRGRYLLLECPYVGWPLDLPQRLFRVALAGFVPVLAHPERNPDVKADPDRIRPLVEAGGLVQLTASSIDGRAGRSAAATARRLLDAGLAHLVASDAHSPAVRGVGLSAAVAALDAPALGRWLTVDVPAAILGNEELPERPAAARRRRWWSGLGVR